MAIREIPDTVVPALLYGSLIYVWTESMFAVFVVLMAVTHISLVYD